MVFRFFPDVVAVVLPLSRSVPAVGRLSPESVRDLPEPAPERGHDGGDGGATVAAAAVASPTLCGKHDTTGQAMPLF
jgi:hypothetical protein